MPKPPLKLLPLACLLASMGAQAQAAPDPAPAPAPLKTGKADQKVVPQVTVQGSRANDTETRRLSTAAKMVFGREELDRNGDSNIGEILKRLPGVTMGGPPGRGGGGVRMRGLGNGYTQLLVNGERPPAGFSLESLSPDQVERIEVMRGPVAEHSTQAIAGTINIILREGYQQKDVQLKLADGIEQGRHAPNVSLTAPYKFGKLSVLLNGSIGAQHQHDDSETFNEDRLLDGTLKRQQDIESQTSRRSSNLHLAPRLSYKFDNGDTLNFQPFAMASRSSGDSRATLDQPYTAPGYLQPEYALAQGSSESEFAFFRGFGNWLHRMDAGAKIDVKFGFGAGRNKNSSLSKQFDASGTPTKRFDNSDEGRQHGVSSGGKYTAPMGKGHLLAAGWDVEWQRRSQSSSALLNGQPQFAGSGDSLDADTRRVAMFVQDEWDVTAQFSTYLGLRWEGIRTTSSSYSNDVRNTSSVWSPVLHGVWRIPGHEKDQVRASLTQSYKAPQLNDLIAAPAYATVNQPTTPDRSGNPNLKPELAKGLDIAYEHYLGKSGILSASGFVREIDDLQRRALILRGTPTGPRWLSTPSNVGHARTSGIELEAKFQLAELMQDAPSVDFRANYSHYWSKVDGIPAPDNRLDGQASQTANIGLDYRMKGVPLTFGGSYNWTPYTATQVSVSERTTTGIKRQSDIYALWKLNPATQLRVSANNLAADDYLTGRVVTAGNMAYSAATAARTFTTWTLRLERKM